MPSYISNSKNLLPSGNWILLWIITGLSFLAFILFFEVVVRSTGLRPSISDSMKLWAQQREKASILGNKAFIIIGASRIQLGADLEILEKNLDHSPIQLAINASSFMPVLKNLAQDKTVIGTVLISLTAPGLSPSALTNPTSSPVVRYYEDEYQAGKEPYKVINEYIKLILDNNMVLRFIGAKPTTIIYEYGIKTLLGYNLINMEYLTSNKDRSWEADYQMIRNIKKFYLNRVERHTGQTFDLNGISPNSWRVLNRDKTAWEMLSKKISPYVLKTTPRELPSFDEGLDILMSLIEQIEKRGGTVILLRMPTDKLVWEFDQRAYPRKLYWQKVADRHPKTIHFADYPTLTRYNLPDGSHLDYHDKPSFTKSLAEIIIEKKFLQ